VGIIADAFTLRCTLIKAVIRSKPVKKIKINWTKKDKTIESNGNCDFEIVLFDENDVKVSALTGEKVLVKVEVLGEATVKLNSKAEVTEEIGSLSVKVIHILFA